LTIDCVIWHLSAYAIDFMPARPKSPAPLADPSSLVAIYKCLCDLNRLRILHLLQEGPLCVCHLQETLGIGPTRTSQQLAFLRKHGMVEVKVSGPWRIYSLPEKPGAALSANLACLQDCVTTYPQFSADRVKLAKVRKSICGPEL
jgi:ArsR family transcriptional regulator, arsenate/arsenite/antimonite-responsive transcriptional repressor